MKKNYKILTTFISMFIIGMVSNWVISDTPIHLNAKLFIACTIGALVGTFVALTIFKLGDKKP